MLESFFKAFVSGNNITSVKLTVLIIVFVLLNVYIFALLPRKEVATLNDFHDKTCMKKCNNSVLEKWMGKLRDVHYLFRDDYDHKTCCFTFWELSHAISHIFVGYFYNLYIHVPLSIGFEIYEHFRYECGSYLDIVWNFLGFVVGVAIRALLQA